MTVDFRAPILALVILLGAATGAIAQDKEMTAEQRERIEAAKSGVQVAGMGLLTFVVVSLAVFVASMTPTLIAFMRGHPNAVPILLVNLVTWWTCLGFFACLVWSLTPTEHRVATRRERRYD